MSSGGLSREGLDRMHHVLSAYVERGDLPGLVLAISRRGRVHVDAIGTTSAGGNVPVGRDTPFRLSSLSKPIAAAAAMILVEECALRLDDPVERLLPELAGRRVLKRLESPLEETVPAVRSITLRDLLTFRLGWGIVMAMPGTYPIQRAMDEARLGQGAPLPQVPPSPDEWMRRLGALPLIYQPGERWMYNTGSDVLGVLIARASGQPLAAFLQDRLFGPLGMKDTGFTVSASRLGSFGACLMPAPGTGRLEIYDPRGAESQWSKPPAFPSAAAGLVSTLDDYLAFATMLRGGGKSGSTRVLSRPAVELMTTDHLTPAQKALSGLEPGYFESHGWGFGVSVVTRRDHLCGNVGRYGWDGGLGTSWYTDPREDMITILMTHRAWDSPSPPRLFRDFWTLAGQAIDD